MMLVQLHKMDYDVGFTNTHLFEINLEVIIHEEHQFSQGVHAIFRF